MKGRLIYIFKDGERLCRDGLFRGFASWGTSKECPRTYTTPGRALPTARQYRASVVVIDGDDISVDAMGRISQVIPAGEGKEMVVSRRVEDFFWRN